MTPFTFTKKEFSGQKEQGVSGKERGYMKVKSRCQEEAVRGCDSQWGLISSFPAGNSTDGTGSMSRLLEQPAEV
jgi:hypothetical protein